MFFYILFWWQSVLNPCINSLALIICNTAPRRFRMLRRRLCWFIEFNHPWSYAEPIVVAAIFITPTIDTIAEFIFDDTKPCKKIYEDTDHKDECMTIHGKLLPLGTMFLIIWGVTHAWVCLLADAELKRYQLGFSCKSCPMAHPSA